MRGCKTTTHRRHAHASFEWFETMPDYEQVRCCRSHGDGRPGVARGERSKEIAKRLGISLRTVGAHLTSIYTKLHVDSRASAVAVAMERGLLPRQG